MKRDFYRSLIPGCAAAIAVASIDAAAGFVAAGSRFHALSFASAAVGLVAALTFLAYLVLRWLLVAPLARKAPDSAISIATAVGLSAFLVLLQPPLPEHPVTVLFEILVKIAAASVMGAGVYAMACAGANTAHFTVSRIVGRMLPLVLPIALFVAWIGFVRLGDVTSARFYVALIAGLALAISTARIAFSLHPRFWHAAVYTIFVVYLAAGAAGTFLISTHTPLPTPRARTSPHAVRRVILLSVDTLRRDAVSAFGSTTVNTPGIDRLAGDGVVFRNVFASSSWTLPSFASMLTGLTTRSHGVVMSTAALPDTVVTLAERFRDAGYETQALVTNGILAPHRGFAQGFQHYELPVQRIPMVSMGQFLASRVRYQPLKSETATRDVTDAAIAWIQSRRDRDFFLWVHYLDPHLPYTPPDSLVTHMNMHEEMGYRLEITSNTRPTADLFGDPARRVWARSLYDGEVRYVDSQITRFLDALRDTGIYDDALIVFAVDHGEEFWDHDGFEHGHTLYNELVGVPLIVKTPGSASRGVVDDAVAVYDVTPTVLALCGLRPVDAPLAISLAPYLAGGKPSKPRPIYASATLFRSNFESVVFDGWKYIRSATTGRQELFELATDPLERTNLALDRPDLVARARKLIDEHIRNTEAFRASRGIMNPEFELDKEEVERLRALGYL